MKKLSLNKETLRSLSDQDAQNVEGGDVRTADYSKIYICQSQRLTYCLGDKTYVTAR